ncbi:MAG: hypothetical protein V3T83_09270 [Acidobacteriota bacterium]
MKDHRLGIRWALFLALSAQAGLQAQVVAPSGRTLFSQNAMLRCTARLDYFDELEAGSRLHEFHLPCAINWGIRPATNLVAVLPFRLRHSEAKGEQEGKSIQTGLGDALFLVQYDGFYRKNVPRGYTRLGGQLGIRAPTGSAGFGSHAASYFATGIFALVRDRHRVVTDLQYSWASRDRRGFKAGDRWRYDVAYLYRLLPLEGFRGDNLFVVLEVNGQTAAPSQSGASELPASGGQLVHFSPGVEYLPTRRLVLEFSLPVPIVRDLNGSQPRPKLSWIAGFRILF